MTLTSWESYRRQHVAPNGWRRARNAPGVWVHQETGAEFHPFSYVSTQRKQRWQVLAEQDKAPDPHQSHMDRMRAMREAHHD